MRTFGPAGVLLNADAPGFAAATGEPLATLGLGVEEPTALTELAAGPVLADVEGLGVMEGLGAADAHAESRMTLIPSAIAVLWRGRGLSTFFSTDEASSTLNGSRVPGEFITGVLLLMPTSDAPGNGGMGRMRLLG